MGEDEEGGEREGGREGYSNGLTLVWKCARCKDDGGIRDGGEYCQSLARQASHGNASLEAVLLELVAFKVHAS